MSDTFTTPYPVILRDLYAGLAMMSFVHTYKGASINDEMMSAWAFDMATAMMRKRLEAA